MNVQKTTQLVDWGIAAILLVLLVVLSPGLPVGGAAFCLGLAWFGLAYTSGFSPSGTILLLLFATRWELVQSLPATAFLASAFGVSAWAVSNWKRNKTTAFVSGILWTLPVLLVPGLFLLTLSGYPRLSRVHSDHPKITRWPGVLIILVAVGISVFMESFPDVFLRFRDPEAYLEWVGHLQAVAEQMTLWVALPIVAVFEVAQKQPDDIRLTWRNLPMFGMLASVVFLTPELGLGLFYLNSVVLCVILITRWVYAFNGWIPRVALGAGLAFFLVQGGGL